MKTKMILTVIALSLALGASPGLVGAADPTEGTNTSARVTPGLTPSPEPLHPESLTIDPELSPSSNFLMARMDKFEFNSTPVTTDVFAPALDGHSVISFNNAGTHHFFFGSDQGFFYDTRVQDQAGASSGALQLSPYLGFANRTDRGYYAVQYSGSFTDYTNSSLDAMYLNRISAVGGGHIGHAWTWKFGATAVQGDDQLLMTSSLPTAIGPGNTLQTTGQPALYGTARQIAGVDSAATFNWQASRRSVLSFSGNDSYYSFYDSGIDNHIAGANVAYQRTMSLHSMVKVYGESFHTFGSDCTSAGMGLGYGVQLGRRTTIEAEGGPQFSTPNCGDPQRFNMRLAATRTLFETAKVYANYSRDHGSGYLEDAYWEDVVSAGYSQSFKSRYVVETNFGWVKSRQTNTTADYHGLFTAVSFRRQFNKEFAAVASYRYFTHSYASEGWNRNIGMFTVEWTPSRGNSQ